MVNLKLGIKTIQLLHSSQPLTTTPHTPLRCEKCKQARATEGDVYCTYKNIKE